MQDEFYEAAKHEIARRRTFWIHFTVYLLVNGGLIIADLSDGGDFGAYWTTVFWGIGLVVHGVSVYFDSSGKRTARKTEELAARLRDGK